MAATNIQDKPWVGSSHGPKVDVSAPGESVHAARVKKGLNGPEFWVDRSSGTSYAVAQTAGVAALWLAHHGRANLIAQYGKANLQAVFADLVRTTARRPAGWGNNQYGAGIVNADALLAQALPAVVPPLAAAGGSLTTAERLAPYMPDESSDTAAAALDALLPGPSADRDLYAGELAYYLSQDLKFERDSPQSPPPGSTAPRVRPRWDWPSSRRSRHLLSLPGWRDNEITKLFLLRLDNNTKRHRLRAEPRQVHLAGGAHHPQWFFPQLGAPVSLSSAGP